MNELESLHYWLVYQTDGSCLRVSKEVRDLIADAKEKRLSAVVFKDLGGSDCWVPVTHITCVVETSPEIRQTDYEISRRMRQEEKDYKKAHDPLGLEED